MVWQPGFFHLALGETFKCFCCWQEFETSKDMSRCTGQIFTCPLLLKIQIYRTEAISHILDLENGRNFKHCVHDSDVIMITVPSQITGVSIICSTVCLGTDQRKHQSPASLAFVRGIHRSPVDSPHKRPVTRKIFALDGVIMIWHVHRDVVAPLPWRTRLSHAQAHFVIVLNNLLAHLDLFGIIAVHFVKWRPWRWTICTMPRA